MITKTTELDSGMYTCVARTELDEARAQATLIVQDVPNSPQLLSVNCGAREAYVTWTPMGDNRSPILRYALQYNTSFTPDTWEYANDHVPATEQRYAIPMSPWANYTFRVIAWNKIGWYLKVLCLIWIFCGQLILCLLLFNRTVSAIIPQSSLHNSARSPLQEPR